MCENNKCRCLVGCELLGLQDFRSSKPQEPRQARAIPAFSYKELKWNKLKEAGYSVEKGRKGSWLGLWVKYCKGKVE